ncbi:MAG TPA: hypothetical protein VFC19_54430 [Candidatus Limnocylindrales bacterium]|nr:hypothetical protein [Candidatus Limnocylindrales bacterium]
MLRDAEITQLADLLLGLSPAEVEQEASRRLHCTPPAGNAPAIVLYSATPLKMGYEASIQSIVDGRSFDDPASYVETRSVYLAGPDDLVVGRLKPWRDAVELAGLQSVNVDYLDHYYFSHALLRLAADHPRGGIEATDKLVHWLRKRPTATVKVYALDRPIQIFLLWLARLAGLSRLHVLANEPGISDTWVRKSTLHPKVTDVVDMPTALLSGDPDRLLKAEHEFAAFQQELGLELPSIPGYTIVPADEHYDVMDQILLAAKFLRERYGLKLGCFKFSRTGTGEGIRTGVDLADHSTLRAVSHDILANREESVLEAHLFYSVLDVSGYQFKLAPSAHIEAGAVAPGMTLQFLRDTAWEGNVYFDESYRLGLTATQYATIRDSMARLVRAFAQVAEQPERGGLTKGGVDFGIGRLNGRFGDRVVVAAQDLNLFSHGAEYLRAFLAKTTAARANHSPQVYGATKVVRPGAAATLATLVQATGGFEHDRHCEPIASVPGQWAMIAAAAPDPGRAVEQILRYEQHLLAHKLITG